MGGEMDHVKWSWIWVSSHILNLKVFSKFEHEVENPEYFYSCLIGNPVPHQHYHHHHEPPLFQLQSDSEGILTFLPQEAMTFFVASGSHPL